MFNDDEIIIIIITTMIMIIERICSLGWHSDQWRTQAGTAVSHYFSSVDFVQQDVATC